MFYQTPRLLILVDLEFEVEVVQTMLLAPVLGVLELLEGFLRDEPTCAEEAPVTVSAPPCTATMGAGGDAYRSVSSSWLGSLPSVPGGV